LITPESQSAEHSLPGNDPRHVKNLSLLAAALVIGLCVAACSHGGSSVVTSTPPPVSPPPVSAALGGSNYGWYYLGPNCDRGTITSGAGGGPSPTNAALEYGITGTRPLTQADVNDLMRNSCQAGVYVLVSMNVSAQVVNSFTIKISENSKATRDRIAQQKYLDSVAAGQQQQQLNKAKQQAVPTL
jgi:hypothetical protein